MHVEVDEPDTLAGGLRAGDRADADGAVAAEDDRRLRPARIAASTRSATSRAACATPAAFWARRFSRSGRQRRSGMSPKSASARSPASRSARGACSWPGANAPRLVGAPMRANGITGV